MNKKFKKIVMILSVLSLTLASTHLAIKADNAENAGGGHEATSVTAEATTTEPTAQDNQVQVEAATTAPQSTEELSDEAMTSGAMTVADDPVVFEESDFSITSSNTVTGFSAAGLEKAKKMTAESVLTFPESVKEIAANAFIYSKYEQELPNGIVGKVRFHGGITNVGDNAFQGNPEINEVIVDDGEKIRFSQECFAPARKELNNSILPYDATNGGGDTLKKNKAFFSDVPKSSLTKLTLGVRKYEIYYRAFARTNIQNVDFSKAVRDSKIQEFSFYGSGTKTFYSGEGVTWINDAAFYESELEEVTIGPNIGNIRAYAFAENLNLKKLNFHPDAPTQIDNSAFNNCPIEGELVLNKVGQIGGAAFANSKLTKVTLPENGTWYGNGWHGGMFRGSELLETLEFVSLNRHGSKDGKTFHGIPNLKNIIFSYNNSTTMYSDEFHSMKLRALVLPSTVVNLNGNDFQNNPGWIDGDTRVALYRKDADGYVTDNAVADGDSFVINPVFVTYELKNQYGQAIAKELELTVDATRNDVKTSDVKIAKEGDKSNFKLGDILTLKNTKIDGLTLTKVNGADYKDGDAITIDPLKTIENLYSDGYKVGYKKFVISLTYNDPNAKDPNAVIYIEPIVPNNDTNNNNDNNSNNNNTDNTVSPSIIPNEDVSIDALPTEIVEEDIDIDGENTPLGANDIVEGEEEDLEIEGDETPLGKGKIDGKDGKKNTGILAKTGGLHVMLYQMLGLLAVLILGYFGFTFVAKKKKSER